VIYYPKNGGMILPLFAVQAKTKKEANDTY
jgi:hypothetical protein